MKTRIPPREPPSAPPGSIPRTGRGIRLGRYSFAPGVLPTVATLVLLPVLVGLGLWQIERAGWKADLRGEFEARASDAPVELSPALTDAAAMRYRAVSVRGRYTSDRQFLLDNRIHQGRAGFHVLTPMRIEGSTTAVLVNRGWVPLGRTRHDVPDLRVDEQPRVLRGTVVAPGEGGLLLGSEEQANGWPRVVEQVDLRAIEAELRTPLLPYTVQLAPAETDGFVRDWRPFYGIPPAGHRAYALQWFALAATLLVLYLGLNTHRYQRRRTGADAGRP